MYLKNSDVICGYVTKEVTAAVGCGFLYMLLEKECKMTLVIFAEAKHTM